MIEFPVIILWFIKITIIFGVLLTVWQIFELCRPYKIGRLISSVPNKIGFYYSEHFWKTTTLTTFSTLLVASFFMHDWRFFFALIIIALSFLSGVLFGKFFSVIKTSTADDENTPAVL